MKRTHINLTLVYILIMTISTSAQTPDWQWVKRGGGISNLSGSQTTSTGLERILDLCIDADNNYYFLAEINGVQTDYDGLNIQTYSNNNTKDILMVSTDCQGNFRWSKSIGGSANDFANSIEIDNNKNVYITGNTINPGGSGAPNFANDTIKAPAVFDGSLESSRKGMFIIKYNEFGIYQWFYEPEGPLNYSGAPIQKTVIEPNGRTHSLVRFGPGTHLEGQLNVTESLGQSAIVIYDASANLENFILINLEPDRANYDYQFAYDPNLQQYYIADTVRGTEPELSINGFGASTGDDKAFYLAALDNQGQVLWYHENNNVGGWSLGDIAIDDNGDIYFTGYQNNNFSNGSNDVDSFAGYTFVKDPNENDNQHPFLLKLDSNGNLIWGTNAGFYSPFPGRSISINGNDIYLGLGSLNNQWDGQAFGNETPNTGLFSSDGAVLRFNKSNGNLEEVIDLPGTGFDMIMAMDIDSNGNIVVGGHFGGTLLPGHPQSVTKVGGDTDFFIAQYGTGNCTLSTKDFGSQLEINLYPQPAKGMVYLQSQNNITQYEIYSIQGQTLQSGNIENNSLDISSLTTGLYLIKVGDNQGRSKVMKLVVE
jgi:hypothetical protein